jgi:hypothetical protein
MKLISKFILLVFVIFLTTPTIVAVIEKNSDISMFYSFAEEENHKEIKAELKLNFDYPFIEIVKHQKSKIIFENLTLHDNIAEKIFILPPDLV